MKLIDLIESLQQLDPELEVLKQKDDEGNGYSRISGVDSDCFIEKLDFDSRYGFEDVYNGKDSDEYLSEPVQVVVIF